MSTIRKISYTFLMMLIISTSAFAQKTPAADADKAFSTFQYTVAADLYKKAYGKVKKNPVEKRRIMFRMAECYSMTGDFQ